MTRAPLDLPEIPGMTLIGGLPDGGLSIGSIGEPWRLQGSDAQPLGDALTAALDRCGAPGIPRFPKLLMVRSYEHGGVVLGPPIEDRWIVAPEDIGPLRRALAEALAGMTESPSRDGRPCDKSG